MEVRAAIPSLSPTAAVRVSVATTAWRYPVAVAVQLDFKGGTLEQYDEAIERLGFLPGGPSAADELFHWVTKTDDGFRVIDVWESKEAFELYLVERIQLVAAQVGLAYPPDIQFFEVHNYLAGIRWRR
jgi:hypothetical protein